MSDELPGRIRLLFEDAVSNLRFLKQQQWVITNYALVAYGAIYVSAKAVARIEPFFIFLVWAVYFLSLAILAGQIESITKFRRRIDHVYDTYFPYRDHNIYELGMERKGWANRWGYVTALVIVSLLGAVTATLAIITLPNF